MQDDLREWRKGLLVSIGHSIDRMKSNTLSEHDRTLFANMLLQFAQAVMKDTEYMKETAMQETADNILGAFEDLMGDNVDSLELHYDALIQLSAFGEIVTRPEDYDRFKPREDGRTYIDFLPTSMTNEQSNQIVEHLKSIGAKFDPGVGQWYVEADWQMPNQEQSKKEFKAIYYDEKGKQWELLGETKEAVMQAVREEKSERKKTDRCYIHRYDTTTGKYKREGVYLIESGKDVTPVNLHFPYISQKETFDTVTQEIKGMGAKFDVNKKVWYVERGAGTDTINEIKEYLQKQDEGIYLKLPTDKMSSEQFMTIVEQFKQDGARYNPDKKAWYITEKNDRDKFSDYLPSDKSSVLKKLEQNKNLAVEQSKNAGKMSERNKDNYERV